TEVQQTGLSHNDVQADGDQRVHRELRQHTTETGTGGVQERRREQRKHREQQQRRYPDRPLRRPAEPGPPRPQLVAEPVTFLLGRRNTHVRALPRLSPRMPVGRKNNTSTSTRKATTSRHSVPNSICP